MSLQLKRPLVIFDLETTGVDILHDRIIELSYIKVFPNGAEEVKTLRFNPEMPIPKSATDVHHITNEDVADKPVFKQYARILADVFTGCDFAGFNSNRFDIPLLAQEFHRADVDFEFSRAYFVDVQTIFHKKEPRNLSAAYRFYCEKELIGAHGAEADTRATYEILKAQLERYPDLVPEIDKLSAFANYQRNVDIMGRIIYDDNNREIINFGKYKGKTVDEVFSHDPGYYSWICQSDFHDDTKNAFTRLYMRFRQAEKENKNRNKTFNR